MQTQAISVKYLRENFSLIRAKLKHGLSFLLIYRSEPIAKIEPVKEARNKNTLLNTLLSPPEDLQIKSRKSAVELVREERD